MSSKGDYRRDLQALASKLGLEIEVTKGGHLRLRRPGASGLVICPFSPRSAWRALQQTRSQIRKQWPDLEEAHG